jgi:hypothetical protein
MNNFLRTLQQDWEKTLLGAVLFVLLLALVVWWRSDGIDDSPPPAGRARARKSLLSDTALAFVDEPVNAPEVPGELFSFGYKVEVTRPWRKPAETSTTNRNTTPTPPPTRPVTPPKPKPAPPAEPPASRVLTYRGFMESATGQMVAFVTVLDPATKKSRMERLVTGRDIDGIKIQEFSGDVLDVLAPDGKALSIPKGSRRKIVIE